jgi:hypothetical protein
VRVVLARLHQLVACERPACAPDLHHLLSAPRAVGQQSYKQLNIELRNDIWRAPVAAACLAGLLVMFFNILSCAILIK